METSLPRLLRGDNIEPLYPGEIALAISRTEDVVSSVLNRDVDLAGWQLTRLDITADRRFLAPGQLELVLKRLADQPLARTFPVCQPGSVTWRRAWGNTTYIAYDKYTQSGDRRAVGQLRVEAQAKGHGAIRRAVPGHIRPEIVTTGHLLDGVRMAAVQHALVAPIDALIDRCAADVPTSIPAIVHALLARGMRLDKIVRLLGVAVAVRELGWQALSASTSRQTISSWRRELREALFRPEEIDIR